ncbi:hypothetical protein [Tenacibaculum finnmarkense]|uniref:hypothetical protein n=2 Tax=Tenacibaculum finnmarkense TaxID=2781243 RepID=UPI00187B3E30|nr:hypothetical protein [Tenacibaculum finnmarkense]MBE7635198.1 hypothetical protein [Tenacibaculum finnmarkense genomovar ulcerans]MBE7689069.1 hypothetical protein [Tenacibaculum finnmarkense genomovar ulcerans]MCD8411110.1 hypothetical protein [Tenacibaculum finnmarkense genomovar ulcerans]MCD8431144.1 hypothetical protein [Tenacibaculum finnmarkense genomovar ulcerans]MCG8237356.1 hypothetical protein [Tenacibaculum finnmarkense genomovar ulcerans]
MKKLVIILLLIFGISSFANDNLNKNSLFIENVIELNKDIRKMTSSEIESFLGKGWHKNSSKTKYLKKYKKQMKGDTNADFYIHKKTKRIYLVTNKSKITIETNDYLN